MCTSGESGSGATGERTAMRSSAPEPNYKSHLEQDAGRMIRSVKQPCFDSNAPHLLVNEDEIDEELRR